MLKVLGRVTSINVRKVLWLTDEMGIPYEREDWGKPIRDPNVPDFLKLNPNALVPVIVDDGFVLWDSHAILRYLVQKTESGLWPGDLRERAIVDQWMSWQASELNPAWVYAVNSILRRNPAYDSETEVAKSIANWTKMMLILDTRLAEAGEFVANGRFSLADIVIALSTHRWVSVSFDKPKLPAVEAHYAKMQSRPAGASYLGASTP
jgi:glutathione S-transferase